MSAKTLSNLFWLFTFLCIAFLLQTRDVSKDSTNAEFFGTSNEKERASLQAKFPKFYAAYRNVYVQTNDDDTLRAISDCLQVARLEGFSEPFKLKELHLLAADIHQSRWHIVFALDSLSSAQALVFDSQVERRITKLSQYLDQIDKERGLFEEYVATKNTGPAKIFKGKILVAYVFVDDGLNTRWSKKTKRRSQQVLSLVQEWQKEEADKFGVNDLYFINRTFVAKRNPSLKNKLNITFKSSAEAIQRFVSSVAQSLGEENIGDFISKQMKKNNADQGVVFLHTNFDQRSFAQRCGYTHQQAIVRNGRAEIKMISKCKDEYVMLMEKVRRNRWDKIHYAQAHEMMHVFGAADLYNIKDAARYSVTDIMNFQSKQLKNSNIEPITAYAIGWQEKPPMAPFDIVER